MSKESARAASPFSSFRSVLGAVVISLAVIGVLVWAFTRTPPPSKARAIGARLDLAAGEVTVTEGANTSKALSGTPLGASSKIATAKGSRALVRTGDGAGLFLRGETEVELGARGIELGKGEAWVDAPRLEGDSATFTMGKTTVTASDAGVDIKRSGDDVTVYVARGLAILTSPGGRIEINAGEQGVTAGGAAPKITPVAFWQDWTGGMGDHRSGHAIGGSGSGRVYGIDPFGRPGAPASPLGISKQVVKAVIRDGIAETEVDQTFSNPGGQNVEGWYWFTVPAEASVTSFALETDGVLVEGEVIEKREAAAKYAAAVRASRDPALLEWVDGRTYRARIFPVPAGGTRRVVLRYLEMLTTVEGKTRYVYPMRTEDPPRFDEFSLAVDLGREGPEVQVSSSLDATVEDSGRKITMRRSGYVPRADFQLEIASQRSRAPVRAWRFEAGTDQADYVMVRYVPDQDWSKVPPARGDVVVVVDTSAGGDDGARQLRSSTAEAILRALSDEDRFSLVSLDVAPTVLYPAPGSKEPLAPASEGEIAKALEKLADHTAGGATDLGAMFETALERLHGAEQPAIVYVGDGNATSGETATDALLDRLRRSLSGSRARLFCVGVGADARHEIMQQMTRTGGGQYFRIDEPEEATGKALQLTSALKTPTITDLAIDLGAGLDQPFISANGKVSRGEEVLLLARTHHPLPPKVKIKGRLAAKDFESEYPVAAEAGLATSLVPRLWASEYIHRLLGAPADENRSKVLDLGLEYGILTPYTSSIALDSEAAYSQQGIRRRSSKLRGVRLTSLQTERQENELAAAFLPSPVAMAAGCSKSEAPATASEPMADDKQGGTGTRAKGEEGSMGNPGRYAASAPAAAAPSVASNVTDMPVDPQGGRDQAMKELQDLAAVGATATASPAPQSAGGLALGIGQAGGGKGDGIGLGSIGAIGHGGPMKAAAQPKPVERPSSPPPPPPPVVAKDETKKAKQPPPRPTPIEAIDKTVRAGVKRPLRVCSDAASRPLADRIFLWRKRLKGVSAAAELVSQYEAARSSCELPDWRDQAALLDLLQQRVQTEEAAAIFLGHFAGEPDAQRFAARAILRRTVDLRLAAAVSRVLFGDRVDWTKVDRELLDIDDLQKKIVHLRAAMLNAPGDPAGEVRLVRLLARSGDGMEAVAYGRRLRDHGFLTPTLAQQLGDVMADAKLADDALRTYSEIVEFDGTNPASRRLLGDVFLRHGWYPSAYRQYKTLTDLDSKDPANWLRLAAAAAGAGRVDEALRIEREVATDKGSPGPDDPRYWARLWSAARLGLLLAEPPQGSTADGIARQLKALQLFSGPSTLALLTWEDRASQIELAQAEEKKDTLAGESTDASPTGLVSLMISSEGWDRAKWAVRWHADPPGRGVKFTLVTLAWDGKSFTVKTRRGELAQDAKQLAL